MISPDRDRETLCAVQTKNGMKVSEIIALLALCRMEQPNTVCIPCGDDRALPIQIDCEILNLSCWGIATGLRDRIYLMPADMAARRVAEQPKRLKILESRPVILITVDEL